MDSSMVTVGMKVLSVVAQDSELWQLSYQQKQSRKPMDSQIFNGSNPSEFGQK